MRQKKYSYRVVALGLQPHEVEMSIQRLRDQGWTLISTYLDKNRATVYKEPSVVGVFETWEKVKRKR